jgi:hypothetical protein
MNAITRRSFYHIFQTACTEIKFLHPSPKKTRGMSHCLAIYIKKYLKAKEKFWQEKYFTMQKYNLPKIL